MKKIISTLLIAIAALQVNAQAPAKFNYQGIARNNSGAPIPSQLLGIRITIHDASPTGTTVYQETNNSTTNAYGLYTLSIGNGSPVTGTLAGVNWSSGDKYIQVEMDPTGGNSYTDMGTTQLLSVPYASYANEARLKLPYSATQSSSSDLLTFNNTGTGMALSTVSASTINPAMKGVLNSTTGASSLAAIQGYNMSTTSDGIGVKGTHAGNGAGVWGESLGTGAGVTGISNTGSGVYGAVSSGNGAGVQGYASTPGAAGILGEASGTAYSGIFHGGLVGVGNYFPTAQMDVLSTGTTTAVKATSPSATVPAVDMDGPLKVSGSNPTSFIVQGQVLNTNADGYISGNTMMIDHAVCNNDPNAILIATHNWSNNNNNIYLNRPFGIYYYAISGRWYIFMEDQAAMPQTAFDILVIKK